MIEALTFDADQTLWDFHTVLERALRAAAATMIERWEIEPEAVTVERLEHVRHDVAGAFRGRPHSLEEVRRASFERVLEVAGRRDAHRASLEVAEVFESVRFDEIEPYPEVRDVLERIGSEFRLGMLSNGNSDPERCGLGGVFDAVVLGPIHGFAKPEPIAFETIAAQLDVDLGAVVHVGDDWDDVVGAKRAGATAVFINRDDTAPSFRDDADYEVRNLIELEQLVTRVAQQG
jgi:HAD superfamily hydrolase (TIGR01549 family)